MHSENALVVKVGLRWFVTLIVLIVKAQEYHLGVMERLGPVSVERGQEKAAIEKFSLSQEGNHRAATPVKFHYCVYATAGTFELYIGVPIVEAPYRSSISGNRGLNALNLQTLQAENFDGVTRKSRMEYSLQCANGSALSVPSKRRKSRGGSAV
jgi:hypothetical protein